MMTALIVFALLVTHSLAFNGGAAFWGWYTGEGGRRYLAKRAAERQRPDGETK